MPEFDPVQVNALLDVVIKSKDNPHLLALNHAAVTELAKLAAGVAEALAEEQKAAKEEAEAEAAAKAEEEEKKAKEKKEPEYAT
jgi:ribosomal protein L12E/L44/L45/RPP1/RPP2